MSNVWLDLTDVTLADEDTNSILTDNANRAMQAMQTMQAMQVMQVIQDKNYTEKVTISSCAIWWPNL